MRQRIFGRYDVLREAASSPSARVLECIDVVRGERVAVKVFAAWDTHGSGRDALAHFEREVRTMRALDHPSVVPLRDYVPEGPAIVLAWMPGGTLERMLAATGALAPARAVEIASGVLAALGEAHRLGILHRDVKPANVLFDEAGGARLSDFGVAHLGDVSTTATAGVFGTLAYMSPEQREGRPATARSDVFAMGTILREMLTGERPAPGAPPRVRPSEAHRELDRRHDAVVDAPHRRRPRGAPGGRFRGARRRSSDWRGRPRWTPSPASSAPSEGQARVPPLVACSSSPTGPCATRGPAGAVARIEASERALVPRARVRTRRPPRPSDRAASRPGGRRDLAGGAPRANRSCAPSRMPSAHTSAAASRPFMRRARCTAASTPLTCVVNDSGVVLLFVADVEATATIDRDRLALARL